MSVTPDQLKRLRDPFPEYVVQFRAGRRDKRANPPTAAAMAYVDARAVQERFDEVLGPDNWRCSYVEGVSNDYGSDVHTNVAGDLLYKIVPHWICTIELRFEDGWVGKCDAANSTSFEGTKGGVSDAFKRAAVLWGVGRSLYNLPTHQMPIWPSGQLQRDPPLPQWYKDGEFCDPDLVSGKAMMSLSTEHKHRPVEQVNEQTGEVSPHALTMAVADSMGSAQEVVVENPFTPPTMETVELTQGFPAGVNPNAPMGFGQKVLSNGVKIRDLTWGQMAAGDQEVRGYLSWMANMADENRRKGKQMHIALVTAEKLQAWLDTRVEEASLPGEGGDFPPF